MAELVCEVGNHQEQATTYQRSLEKLETQAECRMHVLENLVAQSGSSPAPPALSLALTVTLCEIGEGDESKCCTGNKLTKLLVPKSHQELHFRAAHCNMTAGPTVYNKTLEQIMAQFYWPRMAHSKIAFGSIAITEGPV